MVSLCARWRELLEPEDSMRNLPGRTAEPKTGESLSALVGVDPPGGPCQRLFRFRLNRGGWPPGLNPLAAAHSEVGPDRPSKPLTRTRAFAAISSEPATPGLHRATAGAAPAVDEAMAEQGIMRSPRLALRLRGARPRFRHRSCGRTRVRLGAVSCRVLLAGSSTAAGMMAVGRCGRDSPVWKGSQGKGLTVSGLCGFRSGTSSPLTFVILEQNRSHGSSRVLPVTQAVACAKQFTRGLPREKWECLGGARWRASLAAAPKSSELRYDVNERRRDEKGTVL